MGVLIIIKWPYFFDFLTLKIISAFITFIAFKGRHESKNKPRGVMRLGKIYYLTKFRQFIPIFRGNLATKTHESG